MSLISILFGGTFSKKNQPLVSDKLKSVSKVLLPRL